MWAIYNGDDTTITAIQWYDDSEDKPWVHSHEAPLEFDKVYWIEITEDTNLVDVYSSKFHGYITYTNDDYIYEDWFAI